ncbi:hypothetical protein AURDEDRAFT_154801 [Auricularia subglabra TFB-10046 SS5]|nr:hypothetical protein AURDEDRAFT_154801 [Auricularia subglabra TFB-10046 SS5]
MLSPTILLVVSAGFHRLARAAAASAPNPCTVKAWVRADDLSPNAVSHGELKVKLIQPCPNTVKSIALRLRLDEYAEESTASNTTTSGEFWDWQGDTPMAEWSMTKHKRTAFKVEKTLTSGTGGPLDGKLPELNCLLLDGALSGQDWATGAVFPFSVVSPNVNYPAAIYPLILSWANTETLRTTFGLLYRYTAVVTLAGPNDILTKTVEVPAGFTAFRPTAVPSREAAAPREVVVEAISKRGRFTEYCAIEGQEDIDEASSKEVKKMKIRVTLPAGGSLVQGRTSDIIVSVEDRKEDLVGTNHRTVAGYLERKIVPASAAHGEVESDNDEDARWRMTVTHFDEIHALMWKPDGEGCARYESHITEPLRVRVPAVFPRTTPAGAAPDAPFRIEAILSISVAEHYNAPHMNPVTERHPVMVGGEGRKAAATEIGWEFNECDRSRYHRRTYSARVPVGIVGAVQPTSLTQDAPVYYLDNGGRVPVPRIASGHLSSGAGVSFEEALADPVSLRETKPIPAPRQGLDVYGRYGQTESIDAKAGQYVGALWQSRLHSQNPRHTPANPGHTKMQAVLQA